MINGNSLHAMKPRNYVVVVVVVVTLPRHPTTSFIEGGSETAGHEEPPTP